MIEGFSSPELKERPPSHSPDESKSSGTTFKVLLFLDLGESGVEEIAA
jgi:hypothetical protein